MVSQMLPAVVAPPVSRIVWPRSSSMQGSRELGVADWWSWYGPQVWDARAAGIPGVGRAVSIYSGMIKQCALDAWRGTTPLPRPRILDRPDPTAGRSWWVGLNVEDYLLHGNAIARVTSRTTDGWPSTVEWIPASRVAIVDTSSAREYWYGSTKLDPAELIHVRRSADRAMPARGVGVLEQFLTTFDRAWLEDEYERTALTRSSVPSVAVTTPNPDLSQEEADAADVAWQAKFTSRKPVFLPYGTSITPLGWSPADAQMVEARKQTLVDIANAFNLDGFWLGADNKGLTYKSPGPMYVGLLRTSLEPVMVDLEQGWSDAMLPRGQQVRFDRLALTRDDFASSIDTLTKAITHPTGTPDEPSLLDREEARLYLGLAAAGSLAPVTTTSPVDTVEG